MRSSVPAPTLPTAVVSRWYKPPRVMKEVAGVAPLPARVWALPSGDSFVRAVASPDSKTSIKFAEPEAVPVTLIGPVTDNSPVPFITTFNPTSELSPEAVMVGEFPVAAPASVISLTALGVAVNTANSLPLVSRMEVPIFGDVRVLLVRVSEPANVLNVPAVGNVTFVAPVVVNVNEFAPDVANAAANVRFPAKLTVLAASLSVKVSARFAVKFSVLTI